MHCFCMNSARLLKQAKRETQILRVPNFSLVEHFKLEYSTSSSSNFHRQFSTQVQEKIATSLIFYSSTREDSKETSINLS